MNRKKRQLKAQSKTFPIKLTIGNVGFSFCVVVIMYALFSAFILSPILKHYGIRCKAVITDNESSLVHRHTTNDIFTNLVLETKPIREIL